MLDRNQILARQRTLRLGAYVLLWASLWTSAVTHAALADVSPETTYRWWGAVLTQYVDDAGRTNFGALATSRTDLDRFVAWVGKVSPQNHPERFPSREAVLAYHLNAYNALAMVSVVDAGIPSDFSNFIKRRRFFNWRTVTIGGQDTNLSAYENEVIRPLGEARVHFALNCMVRDCPRLPRAPFQAATLDATLTLLTREFFTQAHHLRIADATREIWVSSILSSYTADFSRDPEHLIDFINRYRPAPLPSGYRLRFIDYDWTINRQP